MSKLYDVFTESGRLLNDMYERLTAVDYDPECEMANAINDLDDLPSVEREIEKLDHEIEKLRDERTVLIGDYESRMADLRWKSETAKIEALDE